MHLWGKHHKSTQPAMGGAGVKEAPVPNSQYVTGLYKELLGREPDVEGFHSYMKALEKGQSREHVREAMLKSPEYTEHQINVRVEAEVNARLAAAKAAEPAAGGAAAMGADAANLAAAPVWNRGVGPVPLEGYDGTKLANLDHKTVKYLFGRVASWHSLENVKSKEDAEALLKSMVPEMKAAGLDIRGVVGDKIQVVTELGIEEVDVVRGAGGGNPGWWWGSEGKAMTGQPAGLAGIPGAPAPGAAPNGAKPAGAALPPLQTVTYTPEMLSAEIDKSSPEAAIKSAAAWVKQHHPEFFNQGDDRPTALKMMTVVIGVLRANGYDATRVVNYADRPVGDAGRYGKDALVFNNQVYDVYGGWGDPGKGDPQALNVGPWDQARAQGARE